MLVNPHDLNNIYQYKDPDMYRIRPELKLCMVKNFFFVKTQKSAVLGSLGIFLFRQASATVSETVPADYPAGKSITIFSKY